MVADFLCGCFRAGLETSISVALTAAAARFAAFRFGRTFVGGGGSLIEKGDGDAARAAEKFKGEAASASKVPPVPAETENSEGERVEEGERDSLPSACSVISESQSVIVPKLESPFAKPFSC